MAKEGGGGGEKGVVRGKGECEKTDINSLPLSLTQKQKPLSILM